MGVARRQRSSRILVIVAGKIALIALLLRAEQHFPGVVIQCRFCAVHGSQPHPSGTIITYPTRVSRTLSEPPDAGARACWCQSDRAAEKRKKHVL